jgi:hypothetical protein
MHFTEMIFLCRTRARFGGTPKTKGRLAPALCLSSSAMRYAQPDVVPQFVHL